MPGEVLLTGDFNCLGVQSPAIDQRLDMVLHDFNLVQRVDCATHLGPAGNLLDLLIHQDGVNIVRRLKVIDVGVADHCLLQCELFQQHVMQYIKTNLSLLHWHITVNYNFISDFVLKIMQ